MNKSFLVMLLLSVLVSSLQADSTLLVRNGIGSRRATHFIDTVADSFLFHPSQATLADREAFSCGYVSKQAFKLESVGGKVNWDHSMQCEQSLQQRMAHFSLEIIELAEQSREAGIVIYLASEQAKQDATYDIRIEIRQKRPDSCVTVYDSGGIPLTGKFPLQSRNNVELRKPYLPWLDGRKQFYSVVCETKNDQLFLVLIQHTKEAIHEYEYTSPLIRSMVERYSDHERLQNRPDAYLDFPEHMRCLPVPYSHPAYSALASGPLYVSWATLAGKLEVLPA